MGWIIATGWSALAHIHVYSPSQQGDCFMPAVQKLSVSVRSLEGAGLTSLYMRRGDRQPMASHGDTSCEKLAAKL